MIVKPETIFTEDEERLIAKMRSALSAIHYDAIGINASNEPFCYNIEATIWPRPLRIDFKAWRNIPGKVEQQYISPIIRLTDDLFNGEEITTEFKQSIDQAVANFVEFTVKHK